MDYVQKHFWAETCEVGDKFLDYLVRNEVLRDARDDFREQVRTGEYNHDPTQKHFLSQPFPKGHVLRQSDHITTWVSAAELLPIEHGIFSLDTFTKPSFHLVQRLDEHHVEVQIRIPAFRAYRIKGRHFCVGLMQRSRTDITTTVYACEGRDKPFTNLDLAPVGTRRLLTVRSPGGTAQSYIIEHLNYTEPDDMARVFNDAMSLRCGRYEYFAARLLKDPGHSTAMQFGFFVESDRIEERLKRMREEEAAFLGNSSVEGDDSESMEDDEGMEFDSYTISSDGYDSEDMDYGSDD